jgi:hypothetical protein
MPVSRLSWPFCLVGSPGNDESGVGVRNEGGPRDQGNVVSVLGSHGKSVVAEWGQL